MLLLSIRDDGVGGADLRRGTGLTGLRDRIEALGGRIQIESQTGSGTLIEVEIPIAGRADLSREQDELLAQATGAQLLEHERDRPTGTPADNGRKRVGGVGKSVGQRD